ncbi:MAG: stalk domain-containing protein [Caldisericia bacterium]|nr:stalk domain-containing protein [Caldisericia bacterium]
MKKILSSFLLFLWLFQSVSLGASQQIGSNERNYVYIKNPKGQEIRIFESGGNYFQDFPLPSGIVVNTMGVCPCGGFILAWDEAKQKLYHIDDESGTIDWQIPISYTVGSITISKHKTRYAGVSNTADQSISLYSEKGNFIRTIQSNGRWKEATDIYLDDWNHLWVLDKVGKKVFLLTEKGTTKNEISSSHSLPLQKIVSLSSDRAGYMYVLNTDNTLHIFDRTGVFQTTFSVKQSPSYSSGITIDPSLNYIYLLHTNGAFSRIDKKGTLQYTVQSPFQEKKKNIVQLQIGSRLLIHYGSTPSVLDFAPFIDSTTGRTYVPIRAITESFGATVTWESKTQTVIIVLDSTRIELQIGNDHAKVNGKTLSLEAPPTIVENRTFVPLRFISESLGATVQWFSEDRVIKIVRS